MRRLASTVVAVTMVLGLAPRGRAGTGEEALQRLGASVEHLPPPQRAAARKILGGIEETPQSATRQVFRLAVAWGLPKELPAQASSSEGLTFDRSLMLDLMTGAFDKLSFEKQVALLDDLVRTAVQTRVRDPVVLLRKTLGGLGPGYVKLGQLLGNQYPSLAELGKGAPPISHREVMDIVRRSRRDSGSRLVASIHEQPLGVGSVGQVHMAVLPDGSLGVLKIIKTGAREALSENLSTMEAVIDRHFAGQAAGSATALKQVLGELRKMTQRETDLRFEARSLGRATHNFRGERSLNVPKVYFADKDLMIEEVAGGSRITDVARASPEKRAELADRLFVNVVRQVAFDGFFHADPYAENVFVDDTGGMTFLDWGLSSAFPRRERIALAKLLYAVARGRKKSAHAMVSRLSRGRPQTAALRHLVDQVLRSPGSALDHVQQLLVRSGIEAGARLPGSLVMASKAIVMAEGLARTIDPSFRATRAIRRLAVDSALATPRRLAHDASVRLRRLPRTTRPRRARTAAVRPRRQLAPPPSIRPTAPRLTRRR